MHTPVTQADLTGREKVKIVSAELGSRQMLNVIGVTFHYDLPFVFPVCVNQGLLYHSIRPRVTHVEVLCVITFYE